ncbi:MAG TPA: SIS domain-containing protein [Elusimicrobiota bacterium]|nr:SIS domain-containing protein [Elusimicrobiota bacterium]
MAKRTTLPGTKPGGTHVTGPGGLDVKGFARWYRERALEQWRALDLDALERLAALIEAAQDEDRFIWICGNGLSAASASALAASLAKTASRAGAKPLKAVSLSDNAALTTAIANDLSFDEVFSRQLEGVAAQGDVVVLISGSGNSKNLLRAAETSRARGAKVVGLLGFDGGKLVGLCHAALLIPSDQYGVIEDMHLAVFHLLTFYLKQRKG